MEDTLYKVYEYTRKLTFKGNGKRGETGLFSSPVSLPMSQFLYLHDKTSDELPPLGKTKQILLRMYFGERAHPKLTKIDLKKWDGQECSWLTFSINVGMVLSNLGLGVLTSIPGDPASTARHKLEVMALAKFDGLFFIALNDSMTHAKVKSPRQNLVNMSM